MKRKAHRLRSYFEDAEVDDGPSTSSQSHDRERIDPDEEEVDDGQYDGLDHELEDIEMGSDFAEQEDQSIPDVWEDNSMDNTMDHDHHEPDSDVGEQGGDTTLRGTETFIEPHPNPAAGAPIRKATPEERLRRDHTNVGRLNDPDLFAVAEILVTSGLSGKKRDKFLKLNRVSPN